MGKPGPKRKPKPIEEFLLPGQVLPLRAGDSYVQRYYQEEFDADDTLAADRRQTPAESIDVEYLSREQLRLRESREVVNVNGVPDGRLMQGIYRRAYGGPRDRPTGIMRQGDG